jgi:tetratricopeptide (TPR) repeat protein
MEHPDDRAWRTKSEEATDRRIAALNHGILSSLSPEALAEVYGEGSSASRDYETEFLLEMEREILGGNPLGAIEQLDLDRQMRSHVPAAIWALRALADLALGRWSDASHDADMALMEDLNFAPAHAIKAEASLRDGDYTWALILADHALSLNADEPRGLGVRAAACYQSGHLKEAVEAGTRSLALVPNWDLPREARALAYLKLNQINKAMADAGVLLESDSQNEVARYILRARK